MDLTQPATPVSSTARTLEQLAAQITAHGLQTHGHWTDGEPGEIAVCDPRHPDLGWAVMTRNGQLTWQRHCRLATTADTHAAAQVMTILLGGNLSKDLTPPPPQPGPGHPAITPNRVLRAWREEAGLTRTQMADALNDTPTAAQHGYFVWCRPEVIAQWEAGRVRCPSRKYQLALHDLTGRDPADLGFTVPAPRRRRQPASVTIQEPTTSRPITGKRAGHLNQVSHSPAFRAADQDARTRSRLLEHLTALRTCQGITQAQIATRMQTTQSFISQLENGGTDPQLSTPQRYARALDTRLNLTLTGPPLPPQPSPAKT
ncbi:MAG: helix-turn-helix domain-containing protein, partial [Streptosporangiaceae bacterium]